MKIWRTRLACRVTKATNTLFILIGAIPLCVVIIQQFITVNNTTCIKSAKLKLGNMFQLQRAIIRPKTERSPGTFNDCEQSLNVPGLRSIFGLMIARCR